MAKKSVKPTKLYVGKKTTDLTVGMGKYKDKTFLWVSRNDSEYFEQIETLYYRKYNVKKKEAYDRVKKLSAATALQSSAVENEIFEVVQLIKEKFTISQLHNHLETKYKFDSKKAGNVINSATILIRKEFELEKDFLLDIHLIRYEEIFEEEMNPNTDNVPAGYKRAVLCEHYLTAMDTLFQKERLIGIHTKKFKLKASSLNTRHKINTDFDITRLSVNEQVEMFGLLKKAKPIEQLIRPIVNNNPLDIDLTIYKQEEQVIEAPIKEAKQTDKIGDAEKKALQSTGKSLHDIEQLMKENMQKKVQEIFENKNKK